MKSVLTLFPVAYILVACGAADLKTSHGTPDFSGDQLPAASARAVVLSGGDSPASNLYSQYLQSKLLNDQTRKVMGAEATTTLFAAGNRPGVAPDLADVHRVVKTDNQSRNVMVVGELPDNHAATLENVRALFAPSRYETAENLFLLVGDHGMPNRAGTSSDNTFSNNCINLWGVEFTNHKANYRDFADRCLSVSELGGLLKASHPKGNSVFAMSQCYSGGFHQMSVRINRGIPVATTNICGFTAVPQDTWASGCTPDADGPSYQGYERYFAEALAGRDIISGAALGTEAPTFEAAHENAVLRDFTVDIPMRTSDYYLWQWSIRMRADDFAAPQGADANAMRNAFESGANSKMEVASPSFASRAKFVQAAAAKVAEKYPELESAVNGEFDALESAVVDAKKQSDVLDNRIGQAGQEEDGLFKNEIAPRWTADVAAGKVAGLDATSVDFERRYSGSSAALAQLALLTVSDADLAAKYSAYLSMRRLIMAQWAKADPATDAAYTRITALETQMNADLENEDTLSRKHGLLRRIAIYRAALGAWVALDSAQLRGATSDTEGLIACEATPFHK